MLQVDWTIEYDTDVELPFVIYDGDGLTTEALQALIDAGTAPRKDLTGKSLGFYLRKKVNTADPPLIYKSTDDDVSIEGTFGGSPDQSIVVAMHDTDTYDPDSSPTVNIKAGRYPYALKVLDDGEEAILAYGTITIVQTAAWE